MGLELKMACPRATAARGLAEGSSAHASKGLKIAGLNLPSPGLSSPPGSSSVGTRKWTLDSDEIFAWLEKGYTEHSNMLIALKAYLLYDLLRGDPRFQDLLRRVGLAE